MILFAFAFLLGLVLLQFFSFLPSPKLVFAALLASFFVWWLKLPGRILLIPLLLGFAWGLGYAHFIVHFSLLPSWEGKTLWLRGKVASLPHLSPFQASFLFQVNQLRIETEVRQVNPLFLLSWPSAPHLRIGDEWLLPVRL